MTQEAIAELLDPTVLRVGINLGNILLVTGEKPNGDPEGIAPDMAAGIAEKLGVKIAIVAERVTRSGLQVATPLAELLENAIAPGTGVDPADFWQALAQLLADFGPRNRELLAIRETMQQQIDRARDTKFSTSE